MKVFIRFQVVPPFVLYRSLVFATGLIVLKLLHPIFHVLPDLRASPPLGDVNLSTSIVKGLSDMSLPTHTFAESYPTTFTRHFFLLAVTTGTSQCGVQLRPVTVFIKFQLVPLLVEYDRLNFTALVGACLRARIL